MNNYQYKSKQTILIRGVADFIGSNLARVLLKRGYNVVGINYFYDYYPRKAKEFNLDLIRIISYF